jgi:tRNA(Ile)-lysidine synthase
MSRQRFLSAAVVCAGGGASLPRSAALDRLWQRIAAATSSVATLSGARVESDGVVLRLMRDDGALPALPWTDGVIDGRYEIDGAGEVFALGGHMARLDRRQDAAVRTLPPAARRALPATLRPDGVATCPLLDGHGKSLVGGRLAAACGAVTREATIGRVGEMRSGVLNMPASMERSVHEHA